MTAVRLAPGVYLVNDRYEVNRTHEGALHNGSGSSVAWYWRDRASPAKSRLFDTKRDALADLDARLTTP